MATGRIGSTPVLRVRWSDQPAAGTTVLSGLDDNSVALVYDAGYEAVYRNGALLSRGNDYTATDGTTVTLLSATLAGDIIEIFANDLVPLTDAISKGQYTAKGALLSATAASTPGVLAVGANDTVLTADSSTSTGLKWATAGSADNYTLINTGGTALTGASTVTVSGISGKNSLFIFTEGDFDADANAVFTLRFNSDTGSNYTTGVFKLTTGSPFATNFQVFANNQSIPIGNQGTGATCYGAFYMKIDGCNATGIKPFQLTSVVEASSAANASISYNGTGRYKGTSAISSVSLISSAGNFSAGTIYVFGA
jgi:hypothetical protein